MKVLVYIYTLAHLKYSVGKYPVCSMYEATENELQGSGMAIFKKMTRVFEVTYFEIIVCPPTLTLNLKC